MSFEQRDISITKQIPIGSTDWSAAIPKSGSVLGLNWTSGTDHVFRWDGAAVAGNLETNFDELALDNIRITTAIPEPSTYALIFGVLTMLGVVVIKRNADTSCPDYGWLWAELGGKSREEVAVGGVW